MLNSFVVGLIRTAVPYVTAWLIGVLALPAGLSGELEASLIVLAGSLWYAIVRGLETRFPSLGWLLGVPSEPLYVHPGVDEFDIEDLLGDESAGGDDS